MFYVQEEKISPENRLSQVDNDQKCNRARRTIELGTFTIFLNASELNKEGGAIGNHFYICKGSVVIFLRNEVYISTWDFTFFGS